MADIKALDSSAPPEIGSNVIVCTGRYSSGKTQFVDCLSRVTKSETLALESDFKIIGVRLDWKGDKVTLVEMPGFDDTNDEEVLSKVMEWMKLQNTKPKGILYFHDITDPILVVPPSMRQLTSFCDDPSKQFIFVTTHWDLIDRARGEKVERDLRFMLELLCGTDVHISRFHKRAADPWRFIKPLLSSSQPATDHPAGLPPHRKANVDVDSSRARDHGAVKPARNRDQGTIAKSRKPQKRPDISVYFSGQTNMEAKHKRRRLDSDELPSNTPARKARVDTETEKVRFTRSGEPNPQRIGRSAQGPRSVPPIDTRSGRDTGIPQPKRDPSNTRSAKTRSDEEEKAQTLQDQDDLEFEERIAGVVRRLMEPVLQREIQAVVGSQLPRHPSPLYITMQNAPVFRSDHSQNTTNEGFMTTHDYSQHEAYWQYQVERSYSPFSGHPSPRSMDSRIPPYADGMGFKSSRSPSPSDPGHNRFEPSPRSPHLQQSPLDPNMLHPHFQHSQPYQYLYRQDPSRCPGTPASSSSTSTSQPSSSSKFSSRPSTRNSSRPPTPPTPSSPTSPSTPTLILEFSDFESEARSRGVSPELQQFCRDLKERVEKRMSESPSNENDGTEKSSG